LEIDTSKIKKNDVIIYQHLYGLHIMKEKVGLVIDIFNNFWIGRREYLILSDKEIKKINEDMITYRKVSKND
tara:strand:- start:390 stop:605 length:216 start_codon:yes stop_codon:yes gene_type:complete